MGAIAEVGLSAELAAAVAGRGPVTIGLVGAGQMGIDLMVQLRLMKGVRLGAISGRRLDLLKASAETAGYTEDDFIVSNSGEAVDRSIEMGRLALAADYESVCASGHVDVVVDATGNPNTGTLIALAAMRNGKHIVMLNVEADVTIGRFLKAEAAKAGIIYTGAAGDEPTSTLEIIGFAQSLGLDIIAAGKGKNNALKFDAMPEAYEEEAQKRNMNGRMLVEFVDGTKTMVEMTALANATGLVPDVPGMHGPAASIEDLAQVLCTKEDGGILSRAGVVDYSIGKGVAPGVFCVVKPRHPRVIERMTDLKVGPGPCYTLYRPYHLTSLEVPLSALKAVLRGLPDMQPLDRPVAECVAVAKRALAPGDILGRIGERDYRGFAMQWGQARDERLIPIGLAEKAKVVKPIAFGQKLTYDNCAPDDGLAITQIRRRLDQADAIFA
ncbi:MAG: homoserine dehydrogenase [Ancalomicrobiaceae bacterium]|nr:homoserine dehydrogenase [Ancalomicrobiaceae bacterium]